MNWLSGNESLRAAHEKYGGEFEIAYQHFRDLSGPGIGERAALWADCESRGENIVAWFRARQC